MPYNWNNLHFPDWIMSICTSIGLPRKLFSKGHDKEFHYTETHEMRTWRHEYKTGEIIIHASYVKPATDAAFHSSKNHNSVTAHLL